MSKLRVLSTPCYALILAGALSGGPALDDAEAPPGRIAWFTTWAEGLAEARRIQRPILLHSAAPQCSGVPGMW